MKWNKTKNLVSQLYLLHFKCSILHQTAERTFPSAQKILRERATPDNWHKFLEDKNTTERRKILELVYADQASSIHLGGAYLTGWNMLYKWLTLGQQQTINHYFMYYLAGSLGCHFWYLINSYKYHVSWRFMNLKKSRIHAKMEQFHQQAAFSGSK